EIDRRARHRRLAREGVLLIRQVRGDRAQAGDARGRPRAGPAEEGQAQPVGDREMVLREEGVDRDEAVRVALAADRGSVEVRVAVRPAAEDVPLRPVPVVDLRLYLDVDPGAGGGLRGPGRDELVEREDGGRARGPGGVP